MNHFFARINVCLLLCLGLFGPLAMSASGQATKTAAYLRFEESGGARRYYVAVYVDTPFVGTIGDIRASLRDTGKNKKLLTTNLELPPGGDDSRFIMRVALAEEDLFKQRPGYRVLIDSYPTATGLADYEIDVELDTKIELDARAADCVERTAFTIARTADNAYAKARFQKIEEHLKSPNIKDHIDASVTKDPKSPQPRKVESVSPPRPPRGNPGLAIERSCISFADAAPPGDYTLNVNFDATAPPELLRTPLQAKGVGPDIPNPSAEKRDLEAFLDAGLTLSSSVEEKEQPDKSLKRVRTTRGVSDLFFAPILNLRKVGTLGTDGGVIQVFTPFYIDSKVSTGKITKDTLALNRIELGSTYEFRHYLNTHDYPDVLRHALSFKHSSDRDFKQDEFKFVYEFQPMFGKLNQPLGSAPDFFHNEIVPDEDDKFGLQIVPIVGVELGRTYRVRDPKEFEGTSRNVRRFYFGGEMKFELTRFVTLGVKDLFYVRGENPKDRTENYFVGTVEAPLGRLGNFRAAHALFLSFVRGEQPPFTTPSVNVFKVGYRIRARGLLINF